MDFASHFTKIQTKRCLLAFQMTSIWLKINIVPWLNYCAFTALLVLCTGLFQRIQYSGLIRSIHHVKMQSNDAIKVSVGI